MAAISNTPTVHSRRRRLARWLLLGIVLLGFASLKAVYDPPPLGDHSRDGGFYYQAARHVAEGRGVVTSVSNYHVGPKELPMANTAYPVWPLVLGGTAALVGLGTAVTVLPELLFFLSLLLLYRFTVVVAERWGEPVLIEFRGWPLLDVGHLTVLLLGFNAVYFRFSSLPYTEPLGFVLLFGALLCALRLPYDPRYRWAVAAGILAGLAYLTRYQFLGAAFAIPASVALAGGAAGARRRYLRLAGASLAASGLLVVPWALHLFSTYGAVEPRLLLDPMAVQMTPELEAFQLMVMPDSPVAFAKDRLAGFLVAFDWRDPASYVASFGPAVYLIPLALAVAVAVAVARVGRWRDVARWACSAHGLTAVASVAVGIAVVAPVHLAHANRWQGWFFAFRQGLALVVLLAVAIAYLGTRTSGWLRGAVVLVALWSVGLGLRATRGEIARADGYEGPSAAMEELAEWIEGLEEPPTFVGRSVYTLGAVSRGRFHGVQCDDSARQMETYFRRVNVDLMVVLPKDRECRFFESMRDRMERIRVFGEGEDAVSVWRPLPPSGE